MRTIVVDDTIAKWIDDVKKDEGIIGVDHGKPVYCDDQNAILAMHVAYIQMKKVFKALGR